jgi:hypothetical protein
MQIDITIENVQMTRNNENIHATHPPYATVAPILHVKIRMDAGNRSINPNNGAAE